MADKRLRWHKVARKQEYNCYNAEMELLGWLSLERVGSHMHWCWYQTDRGIRMSPGCLQEVRDKQKELFKMREKE